jgi:hypothetical protein
MNTQNLKPDSRLTEPANEEVAELAYSFFVAGGRVDGLALEHWLRAKEQLSKVCSSENKSPTGTQTGNDQAKNDTAEKTSAAHTPRRRGKDHQSQTVAGR